MKFIKNFFATILVAFVLISPVISLAQQNVNLQGGGQNVDLTPTAPSVTIVNPIGVNNIQDFIKAILEGVIKIGLPIVALAIIYSGFLFVSARGKPEALKKAKDSLIYSIIGAAILLGSWAIAQLISDTVTSLG